MHMGVVSGSSRSPAQELTLVGAMLSRAVGATRAFTRNYKVMVCGGSGGIGQPMAMLMSAAGEGEL